ncbi:MAG: NTP transferase domain-containing protein [Synergistaceae bacterium]|jgi:CTP:molybdopterin cytidylyltransferase MocA/HD superfamily phosphodiesterase|nr:NTP transferase domain-containing protein [Synergistaceae bacterium]
MKKNGFKHLTAIVLAGGMAERMGVCKVLLPLNGVSALEQITMRMRAAGVGDIVVVTGAREKEVRREAARLGCRAEFNPAFKSGMYSSVLSGVRALPDDVSSFFLLPADIPLVKTATYAALINAFNESSTYADILYPTFRGDRGHPALIGRAMITSILNWHGESGMRGLLAAYAHSYRDVPTGDRSVLLDMDTPEDYAFMREYAEFELFPDADECEELLEIAETPERVVRHARAVTRNGLKIASAVMKHGKRLDMRLVVSACMLHDLAKGQKYHEAKGASWLRKRGYAKVAKIVASHKDLPDRRNIGEAEILYLTDKVTDGEEVSTLENRMKRMEARFQKNSNAAAQARRRINRAISIRGRVEEITGLSLAAILSESSLN